MAITYEQAIQALKAADAAGNIEDARKIAQIAAKLKSNPENIPRGTSEAYDPTQDMSGTQKFLAGTGKAFVDLGRGAEQFARGLVPGESEREKQLNQEVTDSRERDTALMNTGAGIAGNITGNVVPMLATLAIPGANTYTGAATLGAVSGALQPTTQDESRLGNIALGGALGAGGQFAGNQVAKIPGVFKSLYAPLHQEGREQILSNLLRQTAGKNADDVATRLTQANSIIPGSVPTAAEVADSGGIAALQRGIASSAPEDYAERMLSNNAARITELNKLAGTSDALETAIKDRSKAVAPLYKAVSESDALADPSRTVSLIDRIIEKNPARKQLVTSLNEVRESMFEEYPLIKRASDAWKELDGALGKRMSGADREALLTARTVMDRARKGTIGVDEAIEQIKGLKPASATAESALKYAKDTVKLPDYVLRQNPAALKSASDNIGDLLSKRGPTGEKINEVIARELSVIKKSIDHQIGKAVPEFSQAQKLFAEKSAPINQMKIGQELSSRLEPALTQGGLPIRQNAEMFARALRDGDKLAAKVTGFKRADMEKILSPEQLRSLNAIKSDLARKVMADDLGRVAGSNTAQNIAMANMASAAGVPQWMTKFAPTEVIGNLASRAGKALYSDADETMRNELAKLLLDPKKTGALMQKQFNNPTAIMARLLKSDPVMLGFKGAPLIYSNQE